MNDTCTVCGGVLESIEYNDCPEWKQHNDIVYASGGNLHLKVCKDCGLVYAKGQSND